MFHRGRTSLNIYFNHIYVGIIISKICADYNPVYMLILYFLGIFVCTVINIYLSQYIKDKLFSAIY